MRTFLDRFTGNLSPSALLVTIVFWSWFDLVPLNTVLSHAANVNTSLEGLAWSLLFSAVLLLAIATIPAVRNRVLDSKVFAAASFVTGSLGTVAVYLGYLSGNSVVLFAGYLLVGLFQSFGIAVSGSIAVCQGKTNALIHLAASLPFNVVFILLGMFLRPGAGVVMCCLLPLVCALCYKVFLERGANASMLRRGAYSTERIDGVKPTGGNRTARARQFAPLAVLLFVITFAFGCVTCSQMMMAAESPLNSLIDQLGLFIRAIVAAGIFIEYVFRGRQPFILFIAATALMSTAMLLAGAVDMSTPAWAVAVSVVYQTGFALFDLLIWAILVVLHHNSNVSLIQFICVAQAIDQLGVAAGVALRYHTGTAGFTPPVYIGVGALLLVLMVLALANNGLIRQHLRIDLDEGAAMTPELAARLDDGNPTTTDEPNREIDTLPVQSANRPVTSMDIVARPPLGKSARVEALASRYFLTEREAEIARFLAEGRSVPYIASALVVSQNTVKTHVRHIYAKTDVHTKQEFFDLLEHPDL